MGALDHLRKSYSLLSLFVKFYLVLTLVMVVSLVAITAFGRR